MSLRASLEQRAPRRLTARLVKPGREADVQKVETHRQLVTLLESTGKAAEVKKARTALARLEATVTDAEDVVEFRALPPADFEALLADHTDAEGDVDKPAMRPLLLARCATDPDLQDEQWWRERIDGSTFTAGQLDTLWRVAWEVNAGAAGIGGPLPD